ncbi:MAG: PD-(D/E)XK nuclease superfamily protein [Cyanobacteria bacterium P01_A01_bin.80]
MSNRFDDYFSDNPISCANCIYSLSIENDSEDYEYCCRREIGIPFGVDIGADEGCDYWKSLPSEPQQLTPGNKANKSGRSAEHIIGCLFEEKGYYVKYRYTIPGIKGIWGNKIIVDVFCQGLPGFKNGLIIESKNQNSSGSAYQKIPYEIINIKDCYPCETILVVGGEYMQKEIPRNALDWARKQASGKLIYVFTFDEIMNWIIKNF